MKVILAKKTRKPSSNGLVRYKANYLLFLYDFRIHDSNSMSYKFDGRYTNYRITDVLIVGTEELPEPLLPQVKVMTTGSADGLRKPLRGTFRFRL